MARVKKLLALALVLMVGAACVAATQAQQREGGRRGFGGGSSLFGLLRMEQVQKEMKLTEEQTTKVQEMVDKLGAEMRQQFESLRSLEDRSQRREKMEALSDELDTKVREQLRDVVERPQLMRLYQVYMQIRPAVDSFTNQYVARRLELTDAQKSKLAEIAQAMEAAQSELYGSMREATDEQRSEAFQKLRTIRSDADEKALAVLTDEQKATFEEMKGEKFELQRERGRQ